MGLVEDNITNYDINKYILGNSNAPANLYNR